MKICEDERERENGKTTTPFIKLEIFVFGLRAMGGH
jgi:hypothetical protein